MIEHLNDYFSSSGVGPTTLIVLTETDLIKINGSFSLYSITLILITGNDSSSCDVKTKSLKFSSDRFCTPVISLSSQKSGFDPGYFT